MLQKFQVKYDNNKLYERIIKPAYESLKELYTSGKSDICFEIETTRGGRGRGGSVLSWKFIIVTKDTQKKEEQETRSFNQNIKSFFEKELPMKQFIIMEQVNMMPYDKLCELNIRIEKLKTGELEGKNDKARYLCYILIQGFGINPNMIPSKEIGRASCRERVSDLV